MLVWKFFKNYLFSKRSGALVKTIAWISILSVCVGVTALILVTTIMSGFNETIRSRLFGIEPHVIISAKVPGQEGEYLLEEFAKSIKNNSKELESVVLVEQQDAILRTFEGLFGGGIVKGYSQAELDQLYQRVDKLNQRKNDGVLYSDIQGHGVQLGKNEVILGVDLARNLEILSGDELLIIPPESLLLPPGTQPNFQKVKVVSLLYTRLENIDSKYIFYNKDLDLSFLSRSQNRQTQIEVRFKNPQISAVWAEEHKVKEPNFKYSTWEVRNEALFFALKLERIAMTSFLGLAVLITSFSILSALALLISQKRSDYGILITMGLPKVQAQKLFSGIGFTLAGLGIISGTVLGILGSLYLQVFRPKILPDIYYDPTIPAQIEVGVVIFILFVAFGLSYVGTYFPVKALLKMNPTEALRK